VGTEVANEIRRAALLFLLSTACTGGDETARQIALPELAASTVGSETKQSEPCPVEDLSWIRDPVSGRASMGSEDSWMTIEWELELGICPADQERMTGADVRSLRESLRSQISAFAWNLVALRSDEESRTMFLKELNERLEWLRVRGLRVHYIRVLE
jgi:hypothetical protein